ncbi:MAG: AgmX/PglI C-terminal domain-containing protein [Deltaproteobacteria bacterium]|nr:AgmX/PglI C-terminal domain-containing protein [Deltaproteobacteria bacterium]
MVAHAKPAPACPFCKGVVPPDLARAGGNCPHCMLEIPGEEAATDPGLEMRKKQEAEAAKVARVQKRRRGLFTGVLLLLLVAAAGVTYLEVLRQEGELVYDIDEPYVPAASRGAAKVQPEAAEVVASTDGSRGARPRRVPPGEAALPAAAVEGGGTPAAKPAVKYVPTAAGGGDMAVGVDGGGQGGVAIGKVDIGVTRVATDVLKDEEAIFAMAKEVISAYSPQVETCVQQRLRIDESFRGDFKVAFTIQPAGTVKKVKVEPLAQSDAEVEGCIARVVGAWTFGKIAKDFPVKKTFRYAAGY